MDEVMLEFTDVQKIQNWRRFKWAYRKGNQAVE